MEAEGQVPQTGMFSCSSAESSVTKLLGSDVILLTHQPDKSWLKAEEYPKTVCVENIPSMLTTLETSQSPISWLNDELLSNI